MSWFEAIKKKLTRRLIIPAVAIVTTVSLGTYEFAKPASAAAPAPTPAAAPLDDNSVSALLALDHAMETLAARVTPAIVNVTVTSKTSPDNNDAEEQQNGENGDDSNGLQQFFGPFFGPFGKRFQMQPQQPQIEHGLGSGVIISPDGYIVTNNHVVDGATDIRVTLHDRRILAAKLIGRDKLTDLAVIKVNAADLPSVPWGDSTQLHPGQSVLAFGNPLGLRFTVTRGIVSALNRPNPYAQDRRSPGEFIQTDAAINPGNSGGPLVNARGEVVGINTFLISETGGFSGMGFAIPTQIVRPTVAALIKNGKVEHGYIGIGIADVTPDEAKFFNVKTATGAVVSQVEPDSPGEKAGLKVGDVITDLDGKPVNDAGELQVEVGQKQPGSKLDLTVMRDGKSMQVPVTLEAMGARDKGSETASAENGKPRWGIGLSDLTPDVRQQVQAPSDVHGAVVQRVVPGSSADDAGLQRGDIITEVNRHPVHSAADVQRELANTPKGGDALVLVWSPNGGSTFRVLHPTQG
ncbi:MAG TPA: Do family serine endopeptidase [Terriglobales bacterium]|nr:Do family serine endopeptidase [Terriglobales bacterium]